MPEAPRESIALPKPFRDGPWPRRLRPHAEALWAWHLGLVDAYAPALDGDDLTAYYEAERDKAAAGEPVKVVGEEVWSAAYEACRAHDLPLALLAAQVQAARAFKDPIAFDDGRDANAFIAGWAHPHGRLLGHLAGATGSWQQPLLDELATGFFWIGRLAYLPREVARDWLFIPAVDLERTGVTVEQLRAGRVDEAMRRLLWKQSVRARDALAQGESLARDLPRRYRNGIKRWWFGGLEVLNEIRRRDYDVWSEPITVGLRHKIQARFQARFGRTTFQG